MNGIFPDGAKVAMVSPIDINTDDKNKISNHRSVSVLNIFSKVYEIVMKYALVSALSEYMSHFVSAYREGYSTRHVLVRLIEEWRKNLDDDCIVGGVFMDLSKAFDCIPYDLLFAKLDSYGLDRNLLKYINSYLDNRKQCVRINNINRIAFNDIISGAPQGSVVGPILFNAFFNDFFFFIKHATVHNFADDNTLSSFANTFDKLKEILESKSKCAIEWFTRNGMFVNPDKFKAFVIDEKRTNYTNEKIQIRNEDIQIVPSVKLLGITIDDRLNFNEHISSICKSAANQLNALVRLKTFLASNERKVLVNSFILSNFNYCPLVWFVSSSTSLRKIENLH